MLAQVLNRDFTLGTVAATEKQLRSVIANRRAGILGRPDDPREIPTDELEELADALAGAFAAESAPADGPRPAQPGEQAPPPKSDYAYVPRQSGRRARPGRARGARRAGRWTSRSARWTTTAAAVRSRS